MNYVSRSTTNMGNLFETTPISTINEIEQSTLNSTQPNDPIDYGETSTRNQSYGEDQANRHRDQVEEDSISINGDEPGRMNQDYIYTSHKERGNNENVNELFVDNNEVRSIYEGHDIIPAETSNNNQEDCNIQSDDYSYDYSIQSGVEFLIIS
ncbi:hypothetical protein CRE_28088 [Caenorhabditis remanei]|uniref:Uncharacterized protein n=1 Tax=Caenorhabditis remanei TaxID=31234 RepID=E3LM84_CAERE|nr:hypothetical protein CRE_28088 [Caenorhabditis remanei]